MGWVQVAPSLRAWGGILPDRGLGMSACPVLLLSPRPRGRGAEFTQTAVEIFQAAPSPQAWGGEQTGV